VRLAEAELRDLAAHRNEFAAIELRRRERAHPE